MRSNTDLGLKNMFNCEISSRPIHSFFREALSLLVWKWPGGGGGVVSTPPPDRPRYEKCPDRARVKTYAFGAIAVFVKIIPKT